MKSLFGSTMTNHQLRMAEKGNRERLGRILAKNNFNNIVMQQTQMNPNRASSSGLTQLASDSATAHRRQSSFVPNQSFAKTNFSLEKTTKNVLNQATLFSNHKETKYYMPSDNGDTGHHTSFYKSQFEAAPYGT